MKHILIGIDGSNAGFAALRWSAQLAIATNSTVTAVNAFERPYIEIDLPDLQQLLKERRVDIDEWIQPALDAGANIRAEVIEGDPRVVMTEVAERDHADLMVLGRSGHRGSPGWLHIGSVAEHAAHHLDRPLAVIPADSHERIRRIVVGLDGSPASAAAAAWVADVAPHLGADVVAVTVEEPILEWTPSWDARNWRRDAVRSLEAWTRPISATGVDLELLPAERLYPADGLLGVAARVDTDLLVAGTRGTGGFLGLRIGGVAMKLLHRASKPLVLVPPDADS